MIENDKSQTDFRDALGSFATGVTIATTLDASGEPVGVTASSFNSVSVDPPLVLWSLAKSSLSREAFCSSGHFAVHVLAASQEDLSNRFARSGADKFADVDWTQGQLGSPIFAQHAAIFECQTRHQYEGGDHIILVGEVVAYEARDEAPLLFHGGRYAERLARPAGGKEQVASGSKIRLDDDALLHLITAAQSRITQPVHDLLAKHGVSMDDYMNLAFQKQGAGGKTLLPAAWQELLSEISAYNSALEDNLALHATPSEIADTKAILQRLIHLTTETQPADRTK